MAAGWRTAIFSLRLPDGNGSTDKVNRSLRTVPMVLRPSNGDENTCYMQSL